VLVALDPGSYLVVPKRPARALHHGVHDPSNLSSKPRKKYTPLPPPPGNSTAYTMEGFPKIIHQTARDENLPEHWRITSELVRRLNPDWQYILWTDEMNRQLIEEHFSYFLWAFDGYPYGISRADAIRYHILYRYGGVYMDLDIVPKSPLSQMKFVFDANPEDIDVVFPKTPNFVSDQVTNSFMVSKPGAAFMHLLSLELMNNVIPPYFMIPHAYVVDSTGPHFCSRIVHRTKTECLLEQGMDLVDPRICRISLFPPEVFGLCSVCTEDLTQAKMLKDPELYSSKFRSEMEARWPDLHLPPPKCPVGPNTAFQHFNAKSWNKLDSVIVNYIFCNLSRLKSYGIFFAVLFGACCCIRIVNQKLGRRDKVSQDENTKHAYLSDHSDFSL